MGASKEPNNDGIKSRSQSWVKITHSLLPVHMLAPQIPAQPAGQACMPPGFVSHPTQPHLPADSTHALGPGPGGLGLLIKVFHLDSKPKRSLGLSGRGPQFLWEAPITVKTLRDDLNRQTSNTRKEQLYLPLGDSHTRL